MLGSFLFEFVFIVAIIPVYNDFIFSLSNITWAFSEVEF
jgi:hypothetical protein